jgi:hypothetical protein
MVGSRERVSNRTLPEIRPLSTHGIWSHEIVVLNGATVTVKVAHMRLCHSRMPFVRAYPRETQEMVFDAHDRAFAFFKGACERGIYGNLWTPPAQGDLLVPAAWNARIYPACCGTARAPGLDGSPLLLAS